MWISAAGGLALFSAAQVIPVKGVNTNPPERFALNAPPHVEAILKRACMDCHSNETSWPLYSRIAPGSWLMARDVVKGRQHLNLSEWGESDEEERQLDLENCWDQIESGAMPPWFYIYPLHLSARLSDEEKAALKGWMLKHKEQKQDEKAAAEPAELVTQRQAAPADSKAAADSKPAAP